MSKYDTSTSLEYIPNSSSETSTNNPGIPYFLSFIADHIDEIFHPLIITFIVIGTILNLLCLYCFLKIMQRSHQNIYLFVLSLGDTINLYMNFTLPLLRNFFGNFDDKFRNIIMLCRLTGVLTEFFLIFPAWIIVLLTFERLISVLDLPKQLPIFIRTPKHVTLSLIVLAIIILGLSLYRVFDLKGIDQIGAFTVVACNGTHIPSPFMQKFNLIIWAIAPECLTLIMSLIIRYKIQSRVKQMEEMHLNRRIPYYQATKTVLLIAILFLIFHTPTGIIIALSLFYGSEITLGVLIILLSRKLTMFLYEISLSCKFLIYYKTFRGFRGTLRTLYFRVLHRTNSAKLGKTNPENVYHHAKQRTHFSLNKQSITSASGPNESLLKNAEEYQITTNNRRPRTSSTNLSRTYQEQPLTVRMIKSEEDIEVLLPSRSNISRGF